MPSLALVYVRQSRHKESERTVSPEVQEATCRQLPAVLACDEVVVFRDLDVSGGGTAKRANYLAVLERIRAGGVAVVALYDQSRGFRNTADALAFYALMEEHPEIRVEFVHGHFDRSATGGFSYTVLAAAHEMERRMTAEKIAAAYRYRNAEGAATGMPPYGYRRQRDAGFVVEPDEADVVRSLYADYATGRYSSRDLAGGLNARGVSKLRSRSKGLGWVPDTVVDLLQNVAYVAKTYSVSRARREGDLIQAQWEPIVAIELFDRVQQMLGGHRHVGRATVRARYAFAGLLVCSECGRPMRATTNYGISYYGCRRDVALAARCPATKRGVREDRLLGWAEVLFRRIEGVQPSDFAEAVKAMAEPAPRYVNPDSVERVERSLGRLQQLYLWGDITDTEYERQRTWMQEQQASIQSSLHRPSETVQIEGIADAWRRGDALLRRELLGELFEALIVRDGAVVEYAAHRGRVAEVVAMVELANGRPDFAFGGKGGIRTLEGALAPYPLSRRALSTTQPPPRSEGT